MYINNLSHMTKMATMPIYGKNPSNIFFSETNRLILMKLHGQNIDYSEKRKRPKGFICPCTGVKYHNIQTCLLVYAADSGERLQDHWSSGLIFGPKHRLWVLVRTKAVLTNTQNLCFGQK